MSVTVTSAAASATNAYDRRDAFAIAILAGIVLILFAGPLLHPGVVVSNINGDTGQNHVYLRAFGFNELKHGNLPLWNPHLFSGTPFLGSMQSAVLYPLNFYYFFLPIDRAIDIDIALHLFLLGAFTYWWLRNWRMSRAAAMYVGVAVMLCGATFLRVWAGQINVVASLAWAPLLFLSIDRVIAQASIARFPSGWCLVGVFSTSMLVMAGYPQALFITAFCSGFYTLMRLPSARSFIAAALELGTIAIIPVFLTAIQLWTGLEVSLESVRAGNISYEFASSYSMAPEKLLTLVAPAFFGDIVHTYAWGRWGFRDDSLYVGVVTLLFLGAALAQMRFPLARIAVIMSLGTLIIAMGRYTPVHGWLFEYVPGFGKFRSPSKFLFITAFFLSVLSGVGVDAIRRSSTWQRRTGWCGVGMGVVLLVSSAAIGLIDDPAEDGLWWRLLSFFKSMPESTVWVAVDPQLVSRTSRLAAVNLALSGLASLGAGLILVMYRHNKKSLYASMSVGIIELMVFAFAYRDTFTLDDLRLPEVDEVVATGTEEERLLYVVGFENRVSNYVHRLNANSIWGFDPMLLNRYADLMGSLPAGIEDQHYLRGDIYTWGTEPFGRALMLGLIDFSERDIRNSSPLLRMLRCRVVIRPVITNEFEGFLNYIRVRPGSAETVPADAHVKNKLYVLPDVLPRFLLLSEYVVRPEGESVLYALHDPSFEPDQVVVLESEPQPRPAAALGSGQIEVVDESTDHATLHVELTDPAILLVTDSYSKGWRAVPVGTSAQERYEILPANEALRAIPLAVGVHNFRMEYVPAGYRYGRLATLVSGAVYLMLVAVWIIRRRAGRERDRALTDAAS